LLATTLVAVPAFAQGPYSADDVRAGGVMFGQLCVTCHGFNGTGGMGPPLTRPKLLNAPDDAALRAIISEGIPDRGMPRVRRTTPDELRQIVAYVRSAPRRQRRSPAMPPRELGSMPRRAAPTAT
jgi:cytochrome c oxidase cbb3-type subunit III